jgi:hypothetical protein
MRTLGLKIDKIRVEALPCHVIFKMLSIENKERILKVAREKCQVTCKGRPPSE